MSTATPHVPNSAARWMGEVLAVAVLYFVTARLGLLLAIPGGHVTPVWPPSGIALAAILLRGPRLWPGIWLGSFAANILDFYGSPMSLGTELATVAIFGAGGSLTALAGARLLRRCNVGANPLVRVRDVAVFLGLAGMVSCLISATLGVATLTVAGYEPWSNFGHVWLTWWLGDTAGVFVMAPLLLVWTGVAPVKTARRAVELAGCFGLLVAVAYFVFIVNVTGKPLAFLLMPVLVWPAVRFGQRGAVLAVASIALLAVWGTIHQSGPFALGQRDDALLLLELFLSIVVLTALCMAAMVTERDQARAAQQQLLGELESRVKDRTAALRESEQRLTAIMGSVDGIVWEADAATFRFTFVSSRAERMLGYPTAQWLEEPAFWADHIHPEDRDRAVRYRLECTQAKRDHEIEYRMLAADGRTLWLRDIVTVAVEADRPVLLRGLKLDITERKAAEVALRESEDRFRRVFEDGPLGIAMGRLSDGRLIRVNGAFCTMLGYTQEELQRLTFADVTHPEHLAEDWDAVRRMREGSLQRHITEKRYLKKNGEVIWGARALASIGGADGKPVYALTMIQDITERKRAELEMAKLAAIVQSSEDAIIGKNLEGIVTSWNKGAEKIFGYTAGEMIGSSIGRLIPADRPAEESLILGKIRQGESLAHFETQRRTKTGRLIDVSITASPVRDDRGTVIGVSKVARDISARRQAEAEREQLEVQLRQSQKMEAIGTLAGGIAHDFNNILAGIAGFTSLARSAARGDAVLEDYLGEIRQAGQRAADLVQQILAFSRVGDQEMLPVQWRHIVAESAKLLRAAIPSSVEIETKLASTLPAVLGNGTQLHQVMMNLGANAAHAMRDQAGRLTIRLEPVTVDEALARTTAELEAGPYVRLTVSDTGCGMEAGMLERIFEPFFTTKAPGEGSGLGLAVVHGIVRSHRGAIRLTSEPGRGTSFEIYLPALTVMPAQENTDAEELPRGHGERILFVDDEPVLVKLGELSLRHLGYAVDGEGSVLEALARLERDPQAYQLVITDQTMPGMTGLEFAARVRELRPDLPVILSSGYSRSLTPEKIQAAGVKEVLTKPFDATSLARAIHRQLAPAQSR